MSAGTLYVVATPIGNLADASPRALDALRSAHLIACEDTRTTRTLLARDGIDTRSVSLHEHNERAMTGKLISLLLENKTIALVSDAGTPGLSDPGALLVEAAHRAGIRVSPLPGPSAAAAAFSVSGFSAERFLFAGFLPASAGARRKALEALELPWPVILYEAPHRIAATLEALRERFGDQREVLVARELSKKFEEVVRLPLGQAAPPRPRSTRKRCWRRCSARCRPARRRSSPRASPARRATSCIAGRSSSPSKIPGG